MHYSQEFSQPFSVFLLWIARYRSAVYTFLCYMYRAGFIDWSTPLPPPQKGNKRHMSAAIKRLSMNIFQIIWQMYKSTTAKACNIFLKLSSFSFFLKSQLKQGLEIHGLEECGPWRYTVFNWFPKHLRYTDFGPKPWRYTVFGFFVKKNYAHSFCWI